MEKLRQKKTLLVPAAAFAILAGCSTATPYQPLGYPGERGGYTDQQLDQAHWRVSFLGNSLTSREQVETYLLYRAAELTLQQGSGCFTPVSRQTDTDVRYYVDTFGPYGGGFYPGWSPYWNLHGPWGWHYYDPWFGGPFFPSRYDIDTVVSYQAMADIALSSAPCAATPGTFDAAQVVENLQPRIVPPKVR